MRDDTHQDIRNRLFEAAWDAPAFPPMRERTVARARRRAAATVGGAALAAILAIVVGAASLPIETTERTGGFVGEGDDREFLVDITSGEAMEITTVPAMKRAWWLDVSPDGERVAFTSDATGTPEVYVANLDGSGLRQLTRGFSDVAQPVWSPDGDEIAFVALGRDSVRNLYVVDVASGRTRRLTRESRDVWSPDWSPDGTSILFNVSLPLSPTDGTQAAYFPPNATAHQLRVVDVGTQVDRRVLGGKTITAYDGAWTSEGIVFVRGRDLTADTAGRIDLAMLASVGERPESLLEIHLDTDHHAWSPEVSPDGGTIAFARHLDGVEHVFLFDLATGQARPLRPGFLVSWVNADTLLIQDRPAPDA